mgnify:FL=1
MTVKPVDSPLPELSAVEPLDASSSIRCRRVHRKQSQLEANKVVADQDVAEECVVCPLHKLEQLLSRRG